MLVVLCCCCFFFCVVFFFQAEDGIRDLVRSRGLGDVYKRQGNNESNSTYIKNSKRLGSKVHPARFPAELPRFFIEFLTNPGDFVFDPVSYTHLTLPTSDLV